MTAPLLTMPQAAKALAISPRTLRTLTRNGEIPCIRIKTAVRYAPEDLTAFVARSRTQPASANRSTHTLTPQGGAARG